MLVSRGTGYNNGYRLVRSRIPRARYSSSSSDSGSTGVDHPDIAVRLREVLRNVAQPVAVAVVKTSSSSSSSSSQYHGATLTSFTSLTLHPHPLVAFSLRLPSRMADYLRPPPRSTPKSLSDLPVSSSTTTPTPTPTTTTTHSPRFMPRIPLTVSLLSASGQAVAESLSRPRVDQAPLFAQQGVWDDTSDPPALRGSVGSLQCQVVSSIPLRDMGGDSDDLHGSELFICKVLDVAPGAGVESLLHYQQRYVSVGGSQVVATSP